MICTWRDYRPVHVPCFLCGATVQTTVQVRGPIYCAPCRARRRKASSAAANERVRLKRSRAFTGFALGALPGPSLSNILRPVRRRPVRTSK